MWAVLSWMRAVAVDVDSSWYASAKPKRKTSKPKPRKRGGANLKGDEVAPVGDLRK